ncbi:MAG: hypothetical protein O3A49_04530 [Candidatus Marinimicrobia bacterium]|nr:hypothetical protein [Candidatus Neomarinimicrobiota bacterium]
MSDTEIIGVKIKEVRVMTKQEMVDEGWTDLYYNPPAVIVLSNGVIIYPMADPEGNGPGCLVGKDDKQSFYFNV